MMLRRAPLAPKCAHGGDVRLEALLVRAVRPRVQLDQRVQGPLHPGALLLRHVHVVGVDAAQHIFLNIRIS